MNESKRKYVVRGGGRKNGEIMEEMKEIEERKGENVIDEDNEGLDGEEMEEEEWEYIEVS